MRARRLVRAAFAPRDVREQALLLGKAGRARSGCVLRIFAVNESAAIAGRRTQTGAEVGFDAQRLVEARDTSIDPPQIGERPGEQGDSGADTDTGPAGVEDQDKRCQACQAAGDAAGRVAQIKTVRAERKPEPQQVGDAPAAQLLSQTAVGGLQASTVEVDAFPSLAHIRL
jgi:hypothetical protein